MDNLNQIFSKVPQGFHDRIVSTLVQLPDEEEDVMKTNHKKKGFSVRKAAIAAAAAVMLLGTTAMAGGKITSMMMGTNPQKACTSFDETKQTVPNIVKDIRLLETAGNGFAFQQSNTYEFQGQDEDGNVLSSGKGVTLNYGRESETLELNVEPGFIDDASYETATKHSYNGITIYETHYASKYVPADYEMTEEDIQAETEGTYTVNYGTDEISVNEYLFMNWELDGNIYSLFIQDSNLAPEELLAVAKDFIDA